MTSFLALLLTSSIAFQGLVGAEFFSDVDSREGDESKALEIKAKEFWQGLMQSAQGLEATQNAKLSARIEVKLKQLPPEYDGIRDHFNKAVSHLAKADSMLFEEASRSKMLALQRLDQGASGVALCDYVSQWEDALYTAYTRFTGYRTYEKKLARHILSRLTEADTALERAADMAPSMYDESEKAANSARAVMVSRQLGNKKRDQVLRDLAGEIISAAGKQRLSFEEYLFGSLFTAAQDLAREHEQPSQTVMRASLRGVKRAHEPSKPTIQVGAGFTVAAEKTTKVAKDEHSAGESRPPLSKPIIQVGAGFTVAAEKTTKVARDEHSAGESHPPLSKPIIHTETRTQSGFSVAVEKTTKVTEDEHSLPPMIFADGVPVDAEPVVVKVL